MSSSVALQIGLFPSHFEWENLLKWKLQILRRQRRIGIYSIFSNKAWTLAPSPPGDIWPMSFHFCSPSYSRQIQILCITYHFPFLLYHHSGRRWIFSPSELFFFFGLAIHCKGVSLWPTLVPFRSWTSCPQKHSLVWQIPCRNVLCSCRQATELRYISFKRSMYSFWPFPVILPTPRALCVLWW